MVNIIWEVMEGMDVRRNYYVSDSNHEILKNISEKTGRPIKLILAEAINNLADELSKPSFSSFLGISANRGKVARIYQSLDKSQILLDIEKDCNRAMNESRKTYYISDEHHRLLMLMAVMLDTDVSGIVNGCITRLGRKYNLHQK